jgi:hypothetical protein
MRIRILKQTSINGQPARVGQLLEPSLPDARDLLAMGKAEEVPMDPHPVVVTPDHKPCLAPRKPRSSL